MKNSVRLIIVALLLFIASPGMSQPGSIDPTFGDNGIVISPQTPDEEQAYKVALQADNKIVVAGFQGINGSQDFLLCRYNPDGTPDINFGNNGVALFDGGTDSDAAWDMLIQSDGKILLGGSVYNQFTTVDDFAMVRFNADGTPDNSFGTAGFVGTDIDGNWDNAYAIEIQDDGRILLAGDAYSGSKRNVCIVRYNADGSLDPGFGNAGIATTSIGSVIDRTRTMALQDDGKILVAGFFEDGVDDQAFVCRFTVDGVLDNSFENDGIATLDVGGNDDRFWAIVVLPDAKIIAAGSSGTSGEWDYMLVRYLIDGSLDNTFGSNGIALSSFGANDLVADMILQTDGKILTAGGAFTFELVRFNENGYPDMDFGNNGVVNTSIGTSFSFSHSLALQSDGKIIVAGHSRNPTEYDFAICRYHSENVGIINDIETMPGTISIFPNPAKDNVTVEYQLSSDQKISIDLLTVDGKIVEALLIDQNRTAGLHTEHITLPESLAAGTYFIRLSSEKGYIVSNLTIR